ncbi:hypothetical protein BDY21DRAFT_356773 [Lineolata rhizophorae]|uniref:Ribosomal protein S6 n=1 Tax=Lineolata rhizophorae TaxID=578093 RepID=A0A6A6NP98_9PEZI|nr:hypothetical protein BDY21DRAFT_356773 [Lineolata rhizophorae]
MLYELIGCVRPGALHEVKEVARTAGSIVLAHQGVIRGITNWGIFMLPKPTTKSTLKEDASLSLLSSPSSTASSSDASTATSSSPFARSSTSVLQPNTPKRAALGVPKHHTGHYFVMRFDASARSQHTLRKTMTKDPRVLRYSVVKMGTKLSEIKDVKGTADWVS